MRLTASALPRAESCPASCVLPSYPEQGDYAATGTDIDLYVQRAKQGDPAAALAQAPEHLRQYLAGLTLSAIPGGAEYQVAFAYNVLTGAVQRIPSRQDGYPEDMGPEWIFGSTDIVGMRGKRAIVWDLKWGQSTIGRDPGEDLQLGILALMLTRYSGADDCETGFLRAGWDGVLRPETTVLDEWALADIEYRVVAAWKRQQAGDTRMSIGPHCTYCPCRRACPAMAAPLAMIADIEALAAPTLPTLEEVTPRINALTVEQQGMLYQRIDAAIDFLTMSKGVIRDNARTTPVPIGDGKELRAVQWGSRKASPAHKEREDALEAEGRASGEVMTVKIEMVRPMAIKTDKKRGKK